MILFFRLWSGMHSWSECCRTGISCLSRGMVAAVERLLGEGVAAAASAMLRFIPTILLAKEWIGICVKCGQSMVGKIARRFDEELGSVQGWDHVGPPGVFDLDPVVPAIGRQGCDVFSLSHLTTRQRCDTILQIIAVPHINQGGSHVRRPSNRN